MANIAGIADIEIVQRKKALQRKLHELLRSPGQREELQIEHFADPIDQVKSNADREIATQQVDLQARRIREIRAALDKIENDGYGFCEQCEEPIGRKRLDAVPWAGLCVACQSRAEAESQFHEAA